MIVLKVIGWLAVGTFAFWLGWVCMSAALYIRRERASAGEP